MILTTPNIVSVRSRVRFFGSGFYHRDSRPLRETERNPFHHIALGTLADLRYALHTSGFRLTSVSHTHIKPVSYLYGWLAPWMWCIHADRVQEGKGRGAAPGEPRDSLGAVFEDRCCSGKTCC